MSSMRRAVTMKTCWSASSASDRGTPRRTSDRHTKVWWSTTSDLMRAAWAAVRGARLVFHPQLTGSDRTGAKIERWGDPTSPYYEKAMIARSVENTIYFASVNCAMRYQDSATSLLSPDGDCLAHVPYGQEQLLVHDLDLSRATGLCARRRRSIVGTVRRVSSSRTWTAITTWIWPCSTAESPALSRFIPAAGTGRSGHAWITALALIRVR